MTPPLLGTCVSHRHIRAMPHFAMCRAIIVPYPIKKQARKSFAILSLQVWRDMKSTAAGPSKSTGVSQRLTNTERDESQTIPSPEKLIKQGAWSSQLFKRSVPSYWPHSPGYIRTLLHLSFPAANLRASMENEKVWKDMRWV